MTSELGVQLDKTEALEVPLGWGVKANTTFGGNVFL